MIDPDNVFAISAVLAGLAWLGFLVDSHPIGKKTSGVVWVLAIAMLASNTGVIPLASPSYDFVGNSLVPAAIPLLLLKADLRKIFRESGRVMLTFLVACTGTVVAAVLGFYLFDLGDIGAKAAGVYSGGWTGGAVNFVAVSKAVEMTTQEFSETLGASAGVSVIALLLLVSLPSLAFITRFFRSGETDSSCADSVQVEPVPVVFNLVHLTGALALSLSICAIADFFAKWTGYPQFAILYITILTIVIANILPDLVSRLQGDFELGMVFMYLFFAAVGAGTDAVSFIKTASILFFYALSIIVFHLILVLLVARLMRIDLREAIVASAAALVGPAPTAAIAVSRGWHHLVTPGIMCGIFGYVIGTFIGVSVTRLLS